MKQHPISDKTQVVGIMGWPIEDSLSPVMHNAAFAELGIDWTYIPLPVQPPDLEQALKGLVALNIVGANITLPHKQAVIRYMDELSDAAHITGAVNTIHFHNDKLYGYNTDAIGFLTALQEAGCDPHGMRVAILGAGEAARAAIFSLAQAEADSIMVFNRTAERAAFLVDDLAEVFPDCRLQFEVLNFDTLATLHHNVDLIVNTTSVGMNPTSEDSPWPEEVDIPPNAICYDLVYDPLETVFLQRAREAGLKTIGGLGMFIHQGAFALQRWTEHKAPVETMLQACLHVLQSTP